MGKRGNVLRVVKVCLGEIISGKKCGRKTGFL